MKTISYYIVIHNLESKKKFLELNKNSPILDQFVFLLVGCNDFPDVFRIKDANINICLGAFPDNIEHHKTLLTFTAWYALIKNDLTYTDHVGIFEYDTEINFGNFFAQDKRGNSYLKKDTIIGFNPRKIVGDPMFLDPVPGLVDLLPDKWIAKMMKQDGWNSTSNLIMPVKFLKEFVKWYEKMIPEILLHPKHSHYHERCVSIYAINNGYKSLYFPELIRHLQQKSHGIELQ